MHNVYKMQKLQVQAVRDQVYLQVLRDIVTGTMVPGTKVKDTEVATQLDVSRTPVRETLLRLTHEGFLDNHVGRGFVVRELSVEELQEVYPIVWTLETMALRATPLPTKELQAELRALNVQIGADGQDPLRRLELDVVWHRELVRGCGNQTLRAMIDRLKEVLQRYLHAYILMNPRIRKSINDHDLIVDYLAAGDTDRAVAQLEEHYKRNLTIVVETFTDRG